MSTAWSREHAERGRIADAIEHAERRGRVQPAFQIDAVLEAVRRLVPLEPNFHAQDRLGGAILMGRTLGLKKAKAIIALREPRARQRFAESIPEL